MHRRHDMIEYIMNILLVSIFAASLYFAVFIVPIFLQ